MKDDDNLANTASRVALLMIAASVMLALWDANLHLFSIAGSLVRIADQLTK